MELLVRLILLPPLLVAAFNGMMGLFAPGYRRQEWVLGGLALAAVAVPFAVTCSLFFGFVEPEVVRYFTWLEAGSLRVDFAYRIDQLSLLMTMIVTGVGSLIHLYSIGYMKGDPGFGAFSPTSTCSSSRCSTWCWPRACPCCSWGGRAWGCARTS